MMHATAYAHIEVDERGIARVAGTRMKVRQIVLEHTAWKLNAEQIQAGHPHLSIASVHSALAYFYDHKDELEDEIATAYAAVKSFFDSHPLPVTLVEKLKAIKAANPLEES